MAKAVMFLGTGSDVGKSIAATAFCRILKRRGYRVAPFKAQNMSNNSFVTLEGGEIGRAQVVQAEASGVLPSVHMNPILLKPSSAQGSQVILQGKVFGQMGAMTYHEIKPRLKRAVTASYLRLAEDYDVIVMEGAGSCCEMNLKKNDLVNFPMALDVGASCILVADIDRGGVFAQLIGSVHLMTRKEKSLTRGFLINKFRGDPALFQSGITYIEEKTRKPVFGLVPFFTHIMIDQEDSVVVQEDRKQSQPIGRHTVNVAVLKLPAISNFTDLEIMAREPDV
ncbi:MAG: cobyric acid synthase, partial [Deltaproteobacteria bacterium]|nr:cobyric acid synthase [Deltaproteobacteria bacterium]